MSKGKFRRGKSAGLFAVLFAIAFLASSLAGCTGKAGPVDAQKPAGTSEASGANADENIILTWWTPISPKTSAYYKSYEEVPFYKELTKKTGVNFKFLHPPVGQEKEQFNLMVASKDLADIIQTEWYSFPGGPEKAIQDQIIISLNDVIQKYSPNLRKLLDNDGETDKLIKTDSGNYFIYPYVFPDKMQNVYMGPQFRKDWLDELGLSVPETIDEWYTVLNAFKDKKGCSAPLTFYTHQIFNTHAFIGTYGVTTSFYQENGKVKFGPIQPEYKQFLSTFSQWYKDGLIDPDFATNDTKTFDAKVTGDKSGAIVATTFGGLGKYLTLMKDSNPGFKLIAAPWPTLEKGKIAPITQINYKVQPMGIAVSTSNKNVARTAEFLDYGYTEEGSLLYNYGIEGESYTMINNVPTYTELVTKDPKLPLIDALAKYAPVADAGAAFVADPRATAQMVNFQEQADAKVQWAKGDNTRLMPQVSILPEESGTVSSIMTEIKTYVEEMFLKFVLGQESLDKFDEYVSSVKNMKLDKVIEIQQKALERYNTR